MELTKENVRDILDYDKETGFFIYKKRSIELFDAKNQKRACNAWNTTNADKPAFITVNTWGYLCGRVFKKMYLAHRVAWLWTYGDWPENEIDHINHNKQDNRLKNLALSSRSENSKNMPKSNSNKSGVVGVRWNLRTKKWLAYITVNKKHRHLGYFLSIDDAINARLLAQNKFKFHKNHGS